MAPPPAPTQHTTGGKGATSGKDAPEVRRLQVILVLLYDDVAPDLKSSLQTICDSLAKECAPRARPVESNRPLFADSWMARGPWCARGRSNDWMPSLPRTGR